MASLINAAIPFFVGVFMLLVGFRIVGKKPGEDPKFDEWHARFGLFFKIGGPILIVLAVIYLVVGNPAQTGR